MLLGIETEYAISGRTRSGHHANRGELLVRLFELVKQQQPCLLDARRSGVFLANGSRLYVDHGMHPELATPECSDPWEVVRFVRAGERLLAELAVQLADEGSGFADVGVFRCNVDYSGSGTTWGCHESYLHRTKPSTLPDQLIPHLVSRVIYTGAGGFNPLSPGVEFALAPRAFHFSEVVSRDSTSNRGIFHTKDEPLAGAGYHRLHVICGESLCSEVATLLKVGATALIVSLVEAGFRPGDAVQLKSPVDALHAFGADAGCQTYVPLAEDRWATAVQIQRHYLEQAEEACRKGLMPDWGDRLCRIWRDILDGLAATPDSVATKLDWPVKRLVYTRWARTRMTWSVLGDWTYVLYCLRSALNRGDCHGFSLDSEALLDPTGPMAAEVRRLGPLLASKGLDWRDVQRFLAVRQDLMEADTRYGQLGCGIFSQLDREGKLDHRVLDPIRIDQALGWPPMTGRARLRAEWVRRLATRPGSYRCDWTGVWDDANDLYLDLSDPFASQAQWGPVPPAADD